MTPSSVRMKPKRVQWFKCEICGVSQVRKPNCENCGAPRDPQKTIWIERWSLATLADVENAQNTIKCDYCATSYDRRLSACPYCGQGTEGIEFDPPAVPKPSSVPLTRNKPETKAELFTHNFTKASSKLPVISQRVVVVAGIAVAIFAIVVILVLSQITTEKTLHISQHMWNQSIEVSYVSTEHGSCWENECPIYDRVVSSSSEDFYSGEEIEIGSSDETCYDCGSEQVCSEPYWEDVENCETYIEDGVEYEKCTTTPVQRQDCYTETFDTIVEVPIKATATPYARTLIYYEVDEVLTKDIETGWQTGTQTYYPVYQLNPLAQESFTGNYGGEYIVTLVDPEGNYYEYSFGNDFNAWLSFVDGTPVTAQVNLLGVVTKIEVR